MRKRKSWSVRKSTLTLLKILGLLKARGASDPPTRGEISNLFQWKEARK